MLRVYYADTTSVCERGDYPLSEYRRISLARMKVPRARRAALGAELLLCHALSEAFPNVKIPPEIITGEHGKPYLRDNEVYFSLSHSGRLAAVALCDDEVGIDIQEASDFNSKLVKRFYAPDEREYVEQSADRDAAFTEVWSKKESYIKAIGTGLATPLNSFSVVNMTGLLYTCLEGYALSVCVPGRDMLSAEFIKRVELS